MRTAALGVLGVEPNSPLGHSVGITDIFRSAAVARLIGPHDKLHWQRCLDRTGAEKGKLSPTNSDLYRFQVACHIYRVTGPWLVLRCCLFSAVACWAQSNSWWAWRSGIGSA